MIATMQQDAAFKAQRRAALSRHTTQIGLDHVDVELSTQRLYLYFVPAADGVSKAALPERLVPDNIRICTGIGPAHFRIADIRRTGDLPEEEASGGEAWVVTLEDSANALAGVADFPRYTLELVDVPHLDPLFNRAPFSLQDESLVQLDPGLAPLVPAETLSTPEIDYLTKDYASFRQLMLDRLATLIPAWREQHPADLGHVLVEVMAHAADQLSYYQDAVGAEAYLGTARQRVSIRRHARLLDYMLHEGCNARVWVHVQVNADTHLAAGTRLITAVESLTEPVLMPADDDEALSRGAMVFETMHDTELFAVHNQMPVYTWGARTFELPQGATSATLLGHYPDLQAGHVLVFEEWVGPVSGDPAAADPAHRHAVRLREVIMDHDPLGAQLNPALGSASPEEANGLPITHIAWFDEDELPFALPISTDDRMSVNRISGARGNMVLADYGQTVADDPLEPPIAPASAPYCPRLQRPTITHRVPYRHDVAQAQPASAASTQDPRHAMPAIQHLVSTLSAGPDMQVPSLSTLDPAIWQPQRDLLDSDRFTRGYVVEIEHDGYANLRFGDGVHGQAPVAGTRFQATYRIGNGPEGNVGCDAITHLVAPDLQAHAELAGRITAIRNPIAAQGGTSPESAEEVRLYAPQAFKTQERGAIESDYVNLATRHADVRQAVATLRWTGSGYTVFVVVERRSGKPVDAAFQDTLRAFIEPYRVAGYDIAIRAPRVVALNIALTLHVDDRHFVNPVRQSLLETFSNVELGGGRRGFFHPQSFGLGQPVYLSRIVAQAAQIPGVAFVQATRFQRWGRPAQNELEVGRIRIGPLEIARLDNDPAAPQGGRIEFNLQGGN